jgi:hypothetical protein
MNQETLISEVRRLGGKVVHQTPAAVGFTHPEFQTEAIKQIAEHNSLLSASTNVHGTQMTTILVKP